MFSELPTVRQETLEAIGKHDLQDILDNLEQHVEKLKEANPTLWRGVEIAAETVAGSVEEGEEKELLAGNALVAMFVALRIVELELVRERHTLNLLDGEE